jgi:TPR repeat protein
MKPRFAVGWLLSLLTLVSSLALGEPTPAELFKRLREGDTSALAMLRSSADAGNAESQFQLGRAYSFGAPGLPRDDAVAAQWVEKAAQKGHPEAQNNMGYLYSVGFGVPKDGEKAMSWWHRSAEAQFTPAQLNLGLAFLDGKLVAKDDTKAFLWVSRAAAQGLAVAQVNLGMMYGLGIGTKSDQQEALKWYRKAAEQGNITAMTNMASMYASGEAGTKDPAEALRWLQKPVAMGDARAVSLQARVCRENAGLCQENTSDHFVFELADPKFSVTIPHIPAIKMAVHPGHDSKPHLRYLGSQGPYTVSILTPTADAGMTARECAQSEFKHLASTPGAPKDDKIYKARINDNTFVAIYATPVEGAVMLQAFLVSAAGGTHCVQVHASKMSTSKDDFEPWFKGFGKANFQSY